MNQENNSNIILSYVLKKPGKKYSIALIASIFLIIIGVISVYHTLNYGFAFWGINNSVAWGITIANFIFWIGIAHSGTLISAILFLFRQDWRKSMHRAAEVMTLISVACAAFFPLIHTGRPWFSMYWLFPYPNTMDAWQNFQSPLIWDFLAILIYFIVSFIFLYLGLLPDLSAVSGKKNGITSKIYYLFSLGWRGTRTEWKNYNKTYKLVAGLLVPLVISVHSIVSFDFAVTILPG